MLPLTKEQISDAFEYYSKPQTYQKMKADVDGRATEWRDASSIMLPSIPIEEWVPVFETGRWVKKADKYTWLHALDSSGRVLIARSEPLNYKGKDLTEYFFDYTGDGVWVIAVNAKKAGPFYLYHYKMEGERCVSAVRFGEFDARALELEWNGDHLTRAQQSNWIDKGGEKSGKPTFSYSINDNAMHSVYEMTYGKDGDLDRVVEQARDSEGKEYDAITKFQRLPKGMNKNKLFEAVEQQLVDQITEAIGSAKLKEPACVALVQFTGLDTDETGYPPPVYLTTAQARARLSDAGSGADHDDLWAIAELGEQPETVELSFGTEELKQSLMLIFQLTNGGSSRSYSSVRKLFQRVCARLNEVDWTKKLKVTDDFVIIPRDISRELDMLKDVKVCVPKEKLKLLVERGLLPTKVLKRGLFSQWRK